MFRAFQDLGLVTIWWGQAQDFTDDIEVVAYTDPLAHCGEGKELGLAGDFPRETLVSFYESSFPGVSYRYFNICGVSAWFKHWSTEDWRSNCGDGDLDVMPQDIDTDYIDRTLQNAFLNPVYAIDFVGAQTDSGILLKAIDFNPAPKLAGTPARAVIERALGGSKGIAQAISARLDLISPGQNYDNNQIHLSAPQS